MRTIPITCLTTCLLLTIGAATADPAEVFTCDFESETWWQEWGEKEQDAHTATVAADNARKFEPAAGKALRIRVDKGGHYGASLAFDFKNAREANRKKSTSAATCDLQTIGSLNAAASCRESAALMDALAGVDAR